MHGLLKLDAMKGGSEVVAFGQVVEDDAGVLDKLNDIYCDAGGRPYTDVRCVEAGMPEKKLVLC